MASEEKRRTLIALAPLLLSPPPAIQMSQLLYQETEAVDAVGVVSATALAVLEAAESTDLPPRPQQGGHRITLQYLQGLPDTEALWTFRCAPCVSVLGVWTDSV